MLEVSGENCSPPVVDLAALEASVESLRLEFSRSTPWQHVVLDNFLNVDIANRIVASFPAMGKLKATLARTLEARSYGVDLTDADRAIHDVFGVLLSPRFTSFIERVTGISGLSADRDLVGAGIHQGARGSYLRVHADHNTHPNDPKLFRRVNVMLYLNDVWESDWNGDLELWDRAATSCEKRIEPIFNRCAILSVDDSAFHGYGPLRVPSGVTRKALAAYYYSSVPAKGQASDGHPTTMPPLKNEDPVSSLSHRLRRAVLFRFEKLVGTLIRRH
jgi:hypothetical protein